MAVFDQREGRGGVLRGHAVEHVEHQVAADQAEHRGDVVEREGVAGKRPHLVEGAERVAHAALAGSGQQQQRVVGDGDALLVGDEAQPLGHRLRRDGLELVDLRPRQHRIGDAVQLGRGHHEHDVRRRLLDRLQQRVERRGRQHVDLVDEEHLVAVAHRRDRQALDDHLAHVVDPGVGRGVDLEHVDVAALGDLDAGVADPARGRGRTLDAVQGAGQDPGGGGLAAAARPGEDEGLGDAPALEGVAQGPGHGRLTQHVVERLGPPLSRERLVGHEGQ